MKCYTVEYKTTNKIKNLTIYPKLKCTSSGADGCDVKIYDNTESRKIIAEDWGEMTKNKKYINFE